MPKDHYAQTERMLKRIQYNSDKIVRLENLIDTIRDTEVKFQAQIAVIHHCEPIDHKNRFLARENND